MYRYLRLENAVNKSQANKKIVKVEKIKPSFCPVWRMPKKSHLKDEEGEKENRLEIIGSDKDNLGDDEGS